jgi:hypothetical protein
MAHPVFAYFGKVERINPVEIIAFGRRPAALSPGNHIFSILKQIPL